MKIRLWHIGVFVLALLVFAVARAPASLAGAFGGEHFRFERAAGTIWNARLEGVRIGAYEVDALTWRISPLDLLQGKIVVPLRLTGAIEGDAILLANVQGDRRLIIPAMQLVGLPLDSLVLPGETSIRGLDILFKDGACASAQAELATDVLVRAGQAARFDGPPMSGGARCDGEDALVELQGQNVEGDSVNAHARLRRDGAGEWRLTIHNANEETQIILAAAGFQIDPADGALTRREELTWLPF